MSKKLPTILLLLGLALLSGCADSHTINGKEYKPYGVVNEQTVKSDDVTYEISMGSVFVAIAFSETVIMPVYVVGWDLYEPVAAKPVRFTKP
jgi:hypothetical protein